MQQAVLHPVLMLYSECFNLRRLLWSQTNCACGRREEVLCSERSPAFWRSPRLLAAPPRPRACAPRRRVTARSSRMSPASTSSAPEIACHALVDVMNSTTLMCLLLLMSTPDCTTNGPAAAKPNADSAPSAAGEPSAAAPSSSSTRDGDLVVYSATYSPTLEQSEYPAHTNYTIATVDDHFIERVTNATGSFNSRPARVSLPAGEYHVRAQYNGGRFVTFPVVIEPDKTTVVDLDGEALSQGRATAKEMVRLPGGQVVGWSTTSSRSFSAS